jgi:glycosyltransferase involved in cell wall biosynthesis
MIKALQRHCGEVVPIGPLNNRYISLGEILNKLAILTLGKKFDYMHSPLLAKEFARILKPKIKKNRYDILFFSAGSQLLADLDVDIPSIYLSDATFNLMIDYYPLYSDLLKISKRWGNDTEKKAINKADIIIYASEWAAESAIKDYGCVKDKIYFIPCGANFDSVLSAQEIISHRKKAANVLKLLFVGSEWVRKGGDIAFQTMIELNKRGVDTELIVCGQNLPLNVKHEKLKAVGFLNKNDSAQAMKLQNLYMESSFFLLPTRNECFGLVFCEAAAYGLPIISTATGGVSSYVDDGGNGYLLPLKANFMDYANIIQKIWNDKGLYLTLAENSRCKYENELNWDVWGKEVKRIMGEVF